jgi:hypothetical protein
LLHNKKKLRFLKKMDNKVAVQAVLLTLGAAFVLLSVVEWKKLADLVPFDDGTYTFAPQGSPAHPYSPVCAAVAPAASVAPAAVMSLDACQNKYGAQVPWSQGIKAFVYSWIGVGLLVAAFVKPKGVAGGW